MTVPVCFSGEAEYNSVVREGKGRCKGCPTVYSLVLSTATTSRSRPLAIATRVLALCYARLQPLSEVWNLDCAKLRATDNISTPLFRNSLVQVQAVAVYFLAITCGRFAPVHKPPHLHLDIRTSALSHATLIYSRYAFPPLTSH
jgi:hypothetical protein